MTSLILPQKTEKYSLRYLGDPCLSGISAIITTPLEIPDGLIEAMKNLMEKEHGAGLAAPQVGVNKRIVIVRFRGQLHVMINPRLTFKSNGNETDQEGCLSVPKFYTAIPRHVRVTVAFWDVNFFQQEVTLEGFEARCVQHEIDHLDGKLITDNVTRQQFRVAKRFVEKHRRSGHL